MAKVVYKKVLVSDEKEASSILFASASVLLAQALSGLFFYRSDRILFVQTYLLVRFQRC